jgi:hypothetical protein
MARPTRLRDIFTAFETTGPAYPAEPLDEYRDLAMLAHAWERMGSGDLTVDDVAGGPQVGSAGSDQED